MFETKADTPILLLLAGLAVVTAGVPRPASARPRPPATFQVLFDEAFACRPLEGVPGDEPQRAPALAMRRVALAPLGVSLELPKGWAAPKAAGGYVAEAEGPRARTRVRVTVEALGELDLPAATARYEGRLLGANTASEACRAALTRRYGLADSDARVGVYRSAYPYRGWVTAYVLYQRRGGELVTLEVETRWTRSRRPELQVVDAILRGFDGGAARISAPALRSTSTVTAR